MGAPSTAYLLEKLPFHKYGIAKYDGYLALKLLEYGNNIKSLFYLDALIIAENEATGKLGFIGLIEDSPSALNYKMHNASRFNKGRLKNPVNGKFYIVLNDGGLNTRGYVWGAQITSTVIWNITVRSNFVAAYYIGTSEYGFRTRLRNPENTGWESWDIHNLQAINGAIPQKTNRDVDSPGFESDMRLLQVQPFITNSEGTFYGGPAEILPTAQPWVFYGDNTIWYIDTEEPGIGTKVFTGEDFSGYQQGPTGNHNFGIDQYRYWRYGFDVFADNWSILELIDNTPQPPDPTPTKFHYEGYSENSQAAANAQVMGGAYQYIGDLWQDPSDNRWYTSYSGTSPNFSFSGIPSDGYYADGDISQITGELGPLVDGYQQ